SLFSSAMMLAFQGVAFLMFAFYVAQVSIGSFIAFNAAFGQFFSGLSSFAGAFVAWYGLTPLFERTKPILEARQEMDGSKVDPGEVTGRIVMDAVSFAYPQASRPVVDSVSLSLEPGEFVAIVGASGAGKSTLLRLLLGFEQPSRGTVSYDGRDLATLDPAILRRQLGVVLQNGQLLPGSVFDNIVANGPYAPARRHPGHAHGAANHGQRGRRHPLRRAEAASAHRPRADPQAAHPVPGRGDQRAGQSGAGACVGRAQPVADHPARHRPSPLHRHGSGPHHRDGCRPHRAGGAL
ncbi:MAG: hypothetical protein B7Z30_17540, partial [Rhizobiales bacterium 12-68-15]